MTHFSEALEKVAARALCREKCAFMGEPPCFEVQGDQGEELPWPNPNCNEPGCQAEAMAVVASLSLLLR